VQRRRLAWLSALPLAAAGSAAAHSLAYRIVEPDPAVRSELLEGSGHAYLAYLPLFLAGCLALLGAALVGHAVAGFRRRPATAAAVWPLALVPPLAFALQEHLERFLVQDHLPLLAALEPTFVVGLVLQVPFAVAAILLARALGGMAETIGRALASPPRPRSSRPPTTVAPGAAVLPRLPLLATRQAGRGPPS
jgi:hypothetical protein